MRGRFATPTHEKLGWTIKSFPMSVSQSPWLGSRFDALDGLRGVAAFSVMLSHCLWSYPAISDAVQVSGDRGIAWVRVLTYTPFHLPWLAHEAVVVFFVLSGLVLTRPYLTGNATAYQAYYASRFIRLLIPCWAALVFAVLVNRFLSQSSPIQIDSWWLRNYATPAPLCDSLRYALLVNGVPAALPPLWSLRWELYFSLLLPAYVFIAKRCRSPRAAGVAALGCLLLIAVGTAFHLECAEYMPMFLLGALINGRCFCNGGCNNSASTVLPALASVALLPLEWYVRGLTWNLPLLGIARIVSIAAAAGTVYSALSNRGLGWVLTRRAVLWIGRRSFSLYLVHFPIVVTTALVSGGQNLPLTLAFGVLGSLVAAELFYQLAETPSLRLAKFLKRFVQLMEKTGV